MKKRLLAIFMTCLMVFTLMPATAFAGTTATDYMYGNSQGVANDEIKFSTAGGSVDLYTLLPEGTYPGGTNGQFGFDISGLPTGVTSTAQSAGNAKEALYAATGRDEDLEQIEVQKAAQGKNSTGTVDTATKKSRPFYLVFLNDFDEEVEVSSAGLVLAKITITVPKDALAKGDSFYVGTTVDSKLYMGSGDPDVSGTNVFSNSSCDMEKWKITISDASEVTANDIALETGTQPEFDTLKERSNLQGKDENGDPKAFTVSDLDVANAGLQWSVIKNAAKKGEVGDYPLTISSGTSSTDITVTLANKVDWKDADNYLYANNFVMKNGSAIAADDVKTAAGVAGKSGGTAVAAASIVVDVTAFSTASEANEVGDYNLTFEVAGTPALSAAVKGTLYDDAVSVIDSLDPKNNIVFGSNNFTVAGKSATEAELTDEWFFEKSGTIATKGSVAGTATIDADNFTALKTLILDDVVADETQDVKLSFEGQELTVTVTVTPGDLSDVTANDCRLQVGAAELSDPAAFAVKVSASGKNKDESTITTWTAANFEGLDAAAAALVPGEYDVIVKPTEGKDTAPIKVTLYTVADDTDKDTKGTIYANDATLETGLTAYAEADLKRDCALLVEDTTGTDVTATDGSVQTDGGVIAAMKAGEKGKYTVTFESTLGKTATVTVTLVDHKTVSDPATGGDGKVFTANDFSVGTGSDTTDPKGDVTPKDVVELSEAKLIKKNGENIPLLDASGNPVPGLAVTGLDALNAAKARGDYGDVFPVTLTYTDPDTGKDVSVTIDVTLDSTRKMFDIDWNNDVDSNDVNTMVLISTNVKVSDIPTCVKAWMCVLDSDANELIDSNDMSLAVNTITCVTAVKQIRVPKEYIEYLKNEKQVEE